MPTQNLVFTKPYVTLASDTTPRPGLKVLGARKIGQGVCCFACDAVLVCHQTLHPEVSVPAPFPYALLAFETLPMCQILTQEPYEFTIFGPECEALPGEIEVVLVVGVVAAELSGAG